MANLPLKALCFRIELRCGVCETQLTCLGRLSITTELNARRVGGWLVSWYQSHQSVVFVGWIELKDVPCWLSLLRTRSGVGVHTNVRLRMDTVFNYYVSAVWVWWWSFASSSCQTGQSDYHVITVSGRCKSTGRLSVGHYWNRTWITMCLWARL